MPFYAFYPLLSPIAKTDTDLMMLDICWLYDTELYCNTSKTPELIRQCLSTAMLDDLKEFGTECLKALSAQGEIDVVIDDVKRFSEY